MRYIFPLLIAVSLVACSNPDGPVTTQMLAHRWAATQEDCLSNYVAFTHSRIALHRDKQRESHFDVKHIIEGPTGDRTAMFVISVSNELAAQTSARSDTSDVAFAFQLQGDGDHIRLVGQGAPDRLMRVDPSNPNYVSFDLQRCVTSG